MKRPEGFDAAPGKRVEPRRPTRSAPAKESPAVVIPIRARATDRVDLRDRPEQPAPAPRRPRERRPEPEAKTDRTSGRASRREARRFTAGSRRRRATWLVLLGFVVALILIVVVAVFSPILALRTIQVDGVSAIPAATVKNALAGEIGTPLALVNDNEIRIKLSHIILIRSYVTEVVPPSTLVVRIVERQAIGVLPHGSGYDEVDPAGVVLGTSASPDGLPIIDIGKGGVNSAGFAAAVKVLLAMPSSVLSEVDSISATTLDNVSVTLNKSTQTILWGSSAQSDLKAQDLAVLLKTCGTQQVLNVTAPLAVACGPAQPTPTPTATSGSGT